MIFSKFAFALTDAKRVNCKNCVEQLQLDLTVAKSTTAVVT